MFKYLLLKVIYDISDVDVVERSRYDMSFKYFLVMAPEEDVINPSSLCKFRKLRLKDMDLMNLLIKKTVEHGKERETEDGTKFGHIISTQRNARLPYLPQTSKESSNSYEQRAFFA